MTPIDYTSSLGSQPLNPPPGIELKTPEQENLYRGAMEFERVFIQQMMKDMQKSSGVPGGDEEQDGSLQGYRDMAQDQMTQSLLDGGGLGLAATLYSQMAEQAGVPTSKPVTAAPITPTTGGAA